MFDSLAFLLETFRGFNINMIHSHLEPFKIAVK